jgi:hypothetical protein
MPTHVLGSWQVTCVRSMSPRIPTSRILFTVNASYDIDAVRGVGGVAVSTSWRQLGVGCVRLGPFRALFCRGKMAPTRAAQCQETTHPLTLQVYLSTTFLLSSKVAHAGIQQPACTATQAGAGCLGPASVFRTLDRTRCACPQGQIWRQTTPSHQDANHKCIRGVGDCQADAMARGTLCGCS